MIFGIAEVKNPYGAGVSEHGMPLAVGLFVNVEIAGRELKGRSLEKGKLVFEQAG